MDLQRWNVEGNVPAQNASTKPTNRCLHDHRKYFSEEHNATEFKKGETQKVQIPRDPTFSKFFSVDGKEMGEKEHFSSSKYLQMSDVFLKRTFLCTGK